MSKSSSRSGSGIKESNMGMNRGNIRSMSRNRSKCKNKSKPRIRNIIRVTAIRLGVGGGAGVE